MKLRLWLVLLLAALAVGVRGTSIYLRYLSADLSSAAPYGASVVGPSLVIDKVAQRAHSERVWPAAERPKPGDRIVALYDHRGRGGEIRGLFDYGAYLKPINTQHWWTLVVDRPIQNGETRRVTLRMPPSIPIDWGPAEWLANLGTDFYLPFLAILTGALIGVLRPDDDQALTASFLFFALGLIMVPAVGQFPIGLRSAALFLQTSAVYLLPYLVFRFFLRFPAPSAIDRHLPWLNGLFLVETVVAWTTALVLTFSRSISLDFSYRVVRSVQGTGLSFEWLSLIASAFAVAMIIFALASVVLNAIRAESRDERRRLRLIAAGAILGLLPAVLMFTAGSTGLKVPLWLLLVAVPLIGLFPLSFAYAVIRHRVFGIRLILRRGLTYALVSRGFLFGEAAVIFLALLGIVGTATEWLAPSPGTAKQMAGTAAATLLLTLGIRQVNRRVLPVIDRRFFRDAYDGRRILTDLGRAVRQMASHPEDLLYRVCQEIGSALHPQRMAIFIAPDVCSRLVPIEGPSNCCDIEVEGRPRRFLLYVDHRSEEHGDGTVQAAPPQRTIALPGRTSLSRHLAACAQGEPEPLEILAPLPARSEAIDRDSSSRPETPCLNEQAVLGAFDARLVLPLVTSGRILGFMLLGEKRSQEPYSREDRELLSTVAGQMAIALDYSQLIGRAAEQAALQREIQIAQEVQRQLFPHERPALRSLRYAGICRAARGVGGDFYDFLPLASDQLGVALADVAGKGLPAALLMASLQALLRSHAPTYVSALADLGRELNRHLLESTDGARFATLFFAVYDDTTRMLRYVNAGHLPPLVLRRNGHAAWGVSRLEVGGMVLGLFPAHYCEGQLTLEPGDRLVVFSDGVTEAMNAAGEMFGEERLLTVLNERGAADIEQWPEVVLSEVGRFVGASAQQDDITVIAAEVA